jgi:hypothetical protein
MFSHITGNLLDDKKCVTYGVGNLPDEKNSRLFKKGSLFFLY